MSIKRITHQVFEYSTIHGLSNIISNDSKIIKFLWLIFLLSVSSLCAFLIYDNISQYLKFEVISRIEIKFSTQMVFPMITICRPNPFVTHNSEDILSDIFNRDEFKDFDYDLNSSVSNFKLNFYSKKTYAILKAANFSEQVKKKFGNQLDNMLLSCLYNFQVCDLERDFHEYYDHSFGNCFTFNAQKAINGIQEPIKLSPQGGLLNGLQLEFFVGAASENNNYFSSENGLTLFIHNHTDLPHTNTGIKISAGLSTYVILDRYTTTKIPRPYSDCTKDLTTIDAYDSELYKKIIKLNRTYTQINCRYMCYQKFLGEKCACQLISYKYYSNMTTCLRFNITNCQIESMHQFLEKKMAENCDCPLECSKTYYNYMYSFNDYPSRYYANILAKHKWIKSKFSKNKTEITYEDLKPRITAINIFYDELKETFITQEKKMNFVDLISGIGGILGLFLGNNLSCSINMLLNIIVFLKILFQ
jgi:hypothetical protein